MGAGERERTDTDDNSSTGGSETETDQSTSETREASANETSRVGGPLDIEDALSELPGADARIDETEATGQITEVQQLPATAVPDSYPISIDSEQAIAFTVQVDFERDSTVYLAWPDTYDESADLACLLNNLDISPDRFADVIGEEIRLVVIDGQWVPKVAAESAKPHPAPDQVETLPTPPKSVSTAEQTVTTGPNYYYYGVLALSGFWAGTILDLFTGLPLMPVPGALSALLFLASPVVYPYLIYRDSQHVEQRSEWSPHIMWALGTIFWVINIFVAAGYLFKRHESMPADR